MLRRDFTFARTLFFASSRAFCNFADSCLGADCFLIATFFRTGAVFGIDACGADDAGGGIWIDGEKTTLTKVSSIFFFAAPSLKPER